MAVPEEDAERLPILGSVREGQPTETIVYARRWWVLAVFSLASFVQYRAPDTLHDAPPSHIILGLGRPVYDVILGAKREAASAVVIMAIVWNTWGPVTESSEVVFGWDDSNIGMLANYGNIAYIIFVLPVCYFMDVKGLRMAMLVCSLLILISTAIRCITLEPVAATWLANACAIISGAATLPVSGSSAISSIWFPPEERATATAISATFGYFGVAMAFVVGPQIVSSPKYSYHNKTITLSDMMELDADYENITQTKNLTNLDALKSDIRELMFVHFGMAAALFVLTLVYFPSRPPTPPSTTASIERTKYKEGLLKLASNRAVWLIVLAYALPSGVLGVWASVLDVNLKPLYVSQKDAGWMGFWQTLAGCSAGLLVARFSDIFMKRMKLFLIILFIGAIGSTVWFTVLCNKYIDFSLVSMYASCILIGLFVNGSIPLFYEISCEASYPVAEGVTGGFLTLLNNLVGIGFLMIMLIKNIGTAWMNWVLLGSVVFALPLLFVFPERYRRTDLDITIIIPPPEKDIQTDEQTNDASANNSVTSTDSKETLDIA